MSRRDQQHRVSHLEQRVIGTVRQTVLTWGTTLDVTDRRILARGYGDGYKDLLPDEQLRFTELWHAFKKQWKARITNEL